MVSHKILTKCEIRKHKPGDLGQLVKLKFHVWAEISRTQSDFADWTAQCVVTVLTTSCKYMHQSATIAMARSISDKYSLFYENPSQSYAASPAILDQTVTVSKTQTQVNMPCFNPSQANRYPPSRNGKLR